MSDLIDRTVLIRILRDEGLYYAALKRVIDSVFPAEDTAEALARELQADLMRVSRLNESLRTACTALVEENKALKEQLQVCKEKLAATHGSEKTCKDCGSIFWGGKDAQFCPACRKKRLSEAAKKNGLNQRGCAAVSAAKGGCYVP